MVEWLLLTKEVGGSNLGPNFIGESFYAGMKVLLHFNIGEFIAVTCKNKHRGTAYHLCDGKIFCKHLVLVLEPNLGVSAYKDGLLPKLRC